MEAFGPPFFCPAAPARATCDTGAGPGHCVDTRPDPSMPRLPAALRRGTVLLACLAALTACEPRAAGATRVIAVTRPAMIEAATRPVDAANLLRDRLLAHDGAGFARLAVPADLHARLAAGWKDGRSRWPLDELPLDGRLPKMLATLQAPGAERALMATFRQQFAGADRDIDQAIRTLSLFGVEYVQRDGDYTAEEREHISQAIAALGEWGLRAPFADKARAQRFFTALTAAAGRSGIDGKAGAAAFSRLGMEASLTRLSPFLATLLAQLRQVAGGRSSMPTSPPPTLSTQAPAQVIPVVAPPAPAPASNDKVALLSGL